MTDLRKIRKTPEPKTAVQLMLITEKYERLQKICAEEKFKMSNLIRLLVDDFLESYGKRRKYDSVA